MAKDRRKTDFFLAVMTLWLTTAVVFAGVFVIAELSHDCAGGECRICLEIRGAKSFAEAFGRIGAGFIPAFFSAYTKAFIKAQTFCFAVNPFALKVKLNC